MWFDTIMVLLEFLAAAIAVAVCGPCLFACAKRMLIGEEHLYNRGVHTVQQAEVTGCDEPNCPYYKKNIRYLMVPAVRRRTNYSPSRRTLLDRSDKS